MLLTPEEGRVIGSLVEKQLTTPQQYPLTLNSLVLACSQSSNRDPVVAYDEQTVQTALTSLRNGELIGFVYPSHGRSVTRYRHLLAERLGLDDRELALLAVLLLRGPQTAGELRARSERMARFDGIDAVDSDLVRLSEKAEPLVVRQSRRPGQKEERWAELLTASAAPGAGAADVSSDRPADSGAAPSRDEPIPPWRDEPATARGPSTEERLDSLAEEVAALRFEVAALQDSFDQLRDELGG
jgi:uncharacterized protein YceH (UPF0502 family)